MLRTFIDRLFGRRHATPPSPVEIVPPPSPAPPASTPPRQPRLPGPPPVGIGARRPLVAPGGALAGFEFYAGAAGRMRLRRLEDEVTTRACTANVLGAMRLCLGQGLTPLAEVPAAWLARSAPELFAPGMHLLLCPDALFEDAAALGRLMARLQQAGCRVGWRSGVSIDGSLRPDFVLVEPSPGSNDLAGWRAAGAAVSLRWPGVDWVMLDLPGIETLEALLQPPLILAACAVDGTRSPSGAVALSPQTAHLLRLLTRLTRDDDNALLVRDIKSDAALALGLLQFLNSAGATPGRPLDSIDQAVMVLGRDTLWRWASQMIVRLAPVRESTTALQSMALARARFFELLARAAGDANPGQMYLFGLVSMLPRLLGCSLDDAVASLALPPAATLALREAGGPWSGYLALADALDRHDMPAAEPLAAAFGGIDAVLALSARAWLPT